jgi:hypothetical protein
MLKLGKNQHLSVLLTVAQNLFPNKSITSLVREITFIEISTKDKHEVGSTF